MSLNLDQSFLLINLRLVEKFVVIKTFEKSCLNNHIHLAPEETFKITFCIMDVHFKVRVMPFGLSNAPCSFQATMNIIFQPHLRRFMLVFFDDILVYNKTRYEHIEHLKHVLQILYHRQFFAKHSKGQFGVSQVDYLGNIISSQGVYVDPLKIEAIKSWHAPSSFTTLGSSLCLTGYYHNFLQNYASMASPLSNLLNKNGLSWNPIAQKAFKELKTTMVSLTVLALPSFNKEFEVTTNTLGTVVGTTLSKG